MKFRSSFGFQLTCLVLIIVVPATLVTADDFASSLGHAACDRGAFVHLFSNLVSNAVKYTRSQPLPRIEIGCEESGGKRSTTLGTTASAST